MFIQSYLIDRSYILTKCALHVNILDLPDELELQTWLRIDREEFLEKIEVREEKGEEFICTGKLVYPIPFYSMTDYPVVKVNLASDSLYPIGKLVLSNEAFRQDWQKGITKARLIELLSALYHQ